MKTVYLDELFALNLVIDYFLLLSTARVCALPFRRGRFAAAAALGGLWSAASLVPAMAFLRLPILRPAPALAMTLIAFGREKRLLRCFLAFLGVSALFGGAVYAAGLSRGTSGGRETLVRVDMRVLVLSFALCWAAVSLVFRRSVKNAGRVLHEVVLERSGRRASFRALDDTGNGLYDPMTGCAALVAEAEALAPLFPEALRPLLRGPPADAVVRIPGSRLLPYADVSGKTRLLLAFRPESVAVDGEARRDLIAAVAPGSLGGEGSYQAIL